MEQTYNIIEAATKEEAEKIALENTGDIVSQTQLDPGEILSVDEIDE